MWSMGPDLNSAVLGDKVIRQFVSTIERFSTKSTMMLGQFPALEPLVSAKVRHPLVPLSTLAAHVVLHGLAARESQRFHVVRGEFEALGELHGRQVVHGDGLWNATKIGYSVSIPPERHELQFRAREGRESLAKRGLSGVFNITTSRVIRNELRR